jgi:chemotaxis protein MotB
MKTSFALTLSAILLLSSCVSKKQYAALEAKQAETQDMLNNTTYKLNICDEDKAVALARVQALEEQIIDLRANNASLIQNTKELTVLTSKGADNLEKSLESMREKDLKINRLQDAINKKDSVTFALVTSLKRSVGIDDPDIEISVEKGVVFISIADKLLFNSGSYTVSSKAKDILAKVAKVVNDKPDFECLVEGHTDDQSYSSGVLIDNWDLSVKRSTSVIRVLQSLGVNPSRLIAAGRSSYVPLDSNDTAEGRSRNRRTRIVVMPKIDQFYDMIEKEMKKLSGE